MHPTLQSLDRILSHYEKKEYASAEKLTDELLAANPDFYRALFLKAVILEETGRASDAEPYYVKSGNRYTLWGRLAVQLHDIDPERALTYYERVSAMDPNNNLIWFNMGALYEKMGRLDKARASFRNLEPGREILSRIVIPLGFMIFLISGAIMMIRRGETGLTAVVIASAIFCIFWIKRDAGRTIQMLMKKNKYK